MSTGGGTVPNIEEEHIINIDEKGQVGYDIRDDEL